MATENDGYCFAADLLLAAYAQHKKGKEKNALLLTVSAFSHSSMESLASAIKLETSGTSAPEGGEKELDKASFFSKLDKLVEASAPPSNAGEDEDTAVANIYEALFPDPATADYNEDFNDLQSSQSDEYVDPNVNHENEKRVFDDRETGKTPGLLDRSRPEGFPEQANLSDTDKRILANLRSLSTKNS